MMSFKIQIDSGNGIMITVEKEYPTQARLADRVEMLDECARLLGITIAADHDSSGARAEWSNHLRHETIDGVRLGW